MAKTLKIAVTGGAASGKSTVLKCLSEKGLTVISLDAVSKDLMKPGASVYNRVIQEFGEDILLSDGTLDRPALRRMITQNPDGREKLESIVQPAILGEMERLIKESEERSETYVVVEVPLLFECGLSKRFDVTVLVAVDESTQIRRLVRRDGVSEDDARRLLDIQMPLHEKKNMADIVIDNSRSYKTLCLEIDRLIADAFEK